MSHLKSHVVLPPELETFYDSINEKAEDLGVHPGDEGVNVADISDLSSLDALVAVGAATVTDGSDGRTVRLLGSPAEEGYEANHTPGGKAVAKNSQFAGNAG